MNPGPEARHGSRPEADRKFARSRRRACAGFTMVELMVVIVIIGLAAAAVVLAIPEPGGSVYAEAERFAARAKAARDGAIVEARPVSLEVDPAGYRFARRVRGEWQETARHDWSEGTVITAAGVETARTRFDSTGLASPLQVTLQRGDREVAVSIGPGGEVDVRR